MSIETTNLVITVVFFIGIVVPLTLIILFYFSNAIKIAQVFYGVLIFIVSKIIVYRLIMNILAPTLTNPIIYAIINIALCILLDLFGRIFIYKISYQDRLTKVTANSLGLGHGLMEAFLYHGTIIILTVNYFSRITNGTLFDVYPYETATQIYQMITERTIIDYVQIIIFIFATIVISIILAYNIAFYNRSGKKKYVIHSAISLTLLYLGENIFEAKPVVSIIIVIAAVIYCSYTGAYGYKLSNLDDNANQ